MRGFLTILVLVALLAPAITCRCGDACGCASGSAGTPADECCGCGEERVPVAPRDCGCGGSCLEPQAEKDLPPAEIVSAPDGASAWLSLDATFRFVERSCAPAIRRVAGADPPGPAEPTYLLNSVFLI